MIAAITNIDPIELFRWLWRYFILGGLIPNLFSIPLCAALLQQWKWICREGALSV